MKKFLFTHALAAKKKFFSLLAIFIACSTFCPLRANEVTIPNDPSTTLSYSYYLPCALRAGNYNSAGTFSVSQQLYFATELSEHSSTTITAIKFYCYDAQSSESSVYIPRKLRVWINETDITAFPTSTKTPKFEAPGTKVFSSKNRETDSVRITEGSEGYTIPFDTPFEWHEGKNIIVTVFDSTGVKASYSSRHYMIRTEGVARFLHQRTDYTDFANVPWNMNNLSEQEAVSSDDRGYVNKITFVFAPAPETAPATPNDLAVSSVTANSATLTWSAVEGATSYDLQQSADGLNWSSLTTNETGTSFTWTGLSAESTQYVHIRAVNANGESDWSDAVTVTTDAVHSHNGINFDKWSSTNSLPTSGNWYLANNVAFGWDNTNVTLTGNLNLCLNGKTADLALGWRIIIPDGKTLSIFDDATGGSIKGPRSFSDSPEALIEVQDGGTLVLNGVAITNNPEKEDETAYAILVNSGASLHISGKTEISAQDAAIYLGTGSVITLDGAISNTTPISINAVGQLITSGWKTNMGSAAPNAFFTSAKNTHPNVNTAGGEVYLVPESTIKLADDADNSSPISNSQGGSTTVLVDRAFTDVQYNTICLPFALSSYNLEFIFGSGYDLRELNSSELKGEELELFFTQPSEFVAGKPYLIKPAKPVTGFLINGASLTATDPGTAESNYVDFHGTFSPTVLEGGNKNLLFLGAGNELFWPEATGNLNGFRAYFEVKGAAKNAVRARIVQKDNTATGIEEVQRDDVQCTKVLRDGQLYLMYEGKMYDVRGQRVR